MDPKPIPKKKSKLICSIAFTKYEIIRHVCEKIFGWKITTDEEDEKWDVLWTDSAIPPERLAKMHPYQRINHFPGMYSISRKNYLAMNLTKLKKKFPNDYNFFPKSWILPCDLNDLKNFVQTNKNAFLIVKPEASCQGRGIFLTKRIENIDPSSRYVVQEYLLKPFLIENLKFDLRIYVLVAGCAPLRIFVHEAGLTRFATEEYCKPSVNNMEEMCMHLTNYAVNKSNPNFIQNESASQDDYGHKRSLASTYEYLQENGYDALGLQKLIDDSIIKTLCSIQPTLAHHYKSCQPEDYANSMCFEILGFDVILDHKAKPFVLEVNHTPSFTTDSPLDWKIKKKVIRDALVLMNISASEKKKFLVKHKEQILKRAVTGKLEKESQEEKLEKVKILQEKRNKWENKHLGGFRKIYPVDGHEEYDKFINTANEIYKEWTGASNSKTKKQEDVKVPKKVGTVKNLKYSKKIEEELGSKSRCNSIPVLTSPSESERSNNTVFERLSKPSLKKFKSSRAPVFPPIIYYDEYKNLSQKTNYPSIRQSNKFVESRNLYSRNAAYRQMAPKIFQFHFDRNNDGG